MQSLPMERRPHFKECSTLMGLRLYAYVMFAALKHLGIFVPLADSWHEKNKRACEERNLATICSLCNAGKSDRDPTAHDLSA